MKIKKFSDFISESKIVERLGVPDAIGPYADIITDKFLEIIKEKEEDQGDALASLFGKKPEPTEFTLTKKDLADVITDKFPLEEIHLSFMIKPVKSNKPFFAEGSQGNFKKKGNGYISEIESKVSVNFLLFFTEMKNPKLLASIKEEIRSTMYHELTHAYEEYKRSVSDSKKQKSLAYTEDKVYDFVSVEIGSSNEVPPEIGTLLMLIYLQASYEVNARVPQVYSLIRDEDDPHKREEIIKKSTPWEQAKALLAFNAQEMYDHMLDGATKYFKTNEKAKDWMNSFFEQLQKQYVSGNDYIIELVDSEHDLSPDEKERMKKILAGHASDFKKLTKKTPLEFLKFWEKKFHTQGEKLRRKLLRLTAY
jgi:hypothetical protein